MFIRFGSPFRGIAPRSAERLLSDGFAQIANNVNLTSGEIRPIRAPLKIQSLASGKLAVYRAEYNSTETWLSWATDVDVIKGPTSPDVEPRYYWTGDGEPRYALFSNLGGTIWALGIPTPTATCTVTPSGGTGSTVTRFYCYTYYQPSTGEESGPSPISAETTDKVDATWAIAAMGAFPANSDTCTITYSSGTSTVTSTSAHWLRAGDQVVISSTTLTVTSVTSSTVFKVSGDYSAATSWARLKNWNTSGMVRRLYRTVGNSGDFQLVADNISATSYSDTLTDSQIEGDSLVSSGWEPPPAQMIGLGVLPNGAAFGFYKNQYLLSEPYQIHAWPISTRYQTDFDIVGAASFGTAVVLATAANPYIADGVEPASVTLQKVDNVWPCLSKRSVVSVGDGVIYASNVGMALISAQGPRIWSEPWFTRVEWEPYTPSSMVAAVAEGKVFVAYTPATTTVTSMLVFDPSTQELVGCSESPQELYADPRNGKLYLVLSDGAYEWNAASQNQMLPYEWKSKEYELPNPVNFGACKVDMTGFLTTAEAAAAQAAYDAQVALNNAAIAAAGGNLGALNSPLLNDADLNGPDFANLPVAPSASSVMFELYINGSLKFARTVTGTDAFRLPAGYKADNVAVRLVGDTARVRSIKLGETMTDLKQV